MSSIFNNPDEKRMLTTNALIPYQETDTEMLAVKSEYVYVYNTDCKTNHDIMDKLNNFSIATLRFG
jgi:hypothetical protein